MGGVAITKHSPDLEGVGFKFETYDGVFQMVPTPPPTVRVGIRVSR